jgi:hypothetical protein
MRAAVPAVTLNEDENFVLLVIIRPVERDDGGSDLAGVAAYKVEFGSLGGIPLRHRRPISERDARWQSFERPVSKDFLAILREREPSDRRGHAHAREDAGYSRAWPGRGSTWTVIGSQTGNP